MQYAALHGLADYLCQFIFMHLQSVAFQPFTAHGGTVFLHHRRQLCIVAQQYQRASLAGVNVGDKVVQQSAGTESAVFSSAVGYHGRFIDNEQRVGVQVF